MPMIVLPLYTSAGLDLDAANLRALDRIAEAFGPPVTYPAQLAAHCSEAGAIDAAPGLAVEFCAGASTAATRATVETIGRAYAAETGIARILYFRESHAPEVLEIRAPAARHALVA